MKIEIDTKITYRYNGPSKSKRPLVIGAKEKLWLKRMVLGEGGRGCSGYKAAALCWAIVNRWFLWPGSRFYPTFVSMMRAFSTDINPVWMIAGDFIRGNIFKDDAYKYRLERRVKICNRVVFQRSIASTVDMFALGLVPYDEPNRISNWTSIHPTPEEHSCGLDVDGDWFFEDKNLKTGFVCVEKEVKHGKI
jgi:hypothetical protein